MFLHVKRMRLFYTASLLLWLKTCLVYYFGFGFETNSFIENVLLWISPISSTLIMFVLICSLFKNHKLVAIAAVSWIHSIILFADLLYHRFYHDFITLPVLFQTSNFGDLGDSAFSLFESAADLLLFADSLVLTIFFVWIHRKKLQPAVITRKDMKIVWTAAVIILAGHMLMYQTVDLKQPASSSNRHMLVQNIGVMNFHLFDVMNNTFLYSKQAFANSNDFIEAISYLDEEPESNSTPFKGIAKGKNVILVSLESVQSFVLNRTIQGEEITPFLNDLMQESYYFEEFYQQTGQGKTSDSEFVIDNSMYPLPQGSVFYTQADNEYYALPEVLADHGYATTVLHANNPTFWNRKEMYRALGYEKFYDEDSFHITEENKVGWGLKDKPFFEQAVELMKELPQPFHSKLITLTNHHPFRLDDADRSVALFDSDDEVVNRYFATVRYLDEAVEEFFDHMKAAGLYEDSIFVLYGDHYGLAPANYEALGQFLGKELDEFDHIRLQRVPLIIHIPGMEGKQMDTVSGQVDIKPTLLHLLGIDVNNAYEFGNNLFNKDRADLAILRNGSFITREFVYTNGTCYDKNNGKPTSFSHCEHFIDGVSKELHYSDKIIYEDLLRFADDLKQKPEQSEQKESEHPRDPLKI